MKLKATLETEVYLESDRIVVRQVDSWGKESFIDLSIGQAALVGTELLRLISELEDGRDVAS